MRKRTKADIRWIKQYRIDNECGLQQATKAWLKMHINEALSRDINHPWELKPVLQDIMDYIDG